MKVGLIMGIILICDRSLDGFWGKVVIWCWDLVWQLQACVRKSNQRLSYHVNRSWHRSGEMQNFHRVDRAWWPVFHMSAFYLYPIWLELNAKAVSDPILLFRSLSCSECWRFLLSYGYGALLTVETRNKLGGFSFALKSSVACSALCGHHFYAHA